MNIIQAKNLVTENFLGKEGITAVGCSRTQNKIFLYAKQEINSSVLTQISEMIQPFQLVVLIR